MPAVGARLREEREERGWSRETLARRLRSAGEKLPGVVSLAHMIKEWEAGKHGVSDRYQALYCQVFGIPRAELFGERTAHTSPWRVPGVELNGAFTPDDEERLIQAARRPFQLDRSAIESMAAILAEQRRLEDKIGSVPVLHMVKSQRQVLGRLVADARGSIRPKVVDVAAQMAQFAGWLYIAADDAVRARTTLDQAAEYAEEIGDLDMVGTVLSWKAHLAERIGQVGRMIGMAEAARRNRHGPGHAYDVFQEARGHALIGDSQTATRLLGEAQEAAAASTPEQARAWEYYYLEPGFFELETGLTYVYLGRDDPRENSRAVESLAAGLAALPEWMRRSEWAGEYIAHQATAHLQAGEAEASSAAVAEAADIARATSSEMLLRKLRRIHGRMSVKWPDHPAVVDLPDALR